MPRFAANLSTLFTEVPFLDRFDRAAQAGFKAVEFLFPYDFAAADIGARLHANNLELVLFNTPPGRWDEGERGMACDPTRIDEFRAGIDTALEYAAALNVRNLHCMAGKLPASCSAAAARRTYVDNLRFVAALAKPIGVTVLIEPLNAFDMPGYCLSSTADALRIIDECGADNLRLQYDIYHAQRSEGELAATIERQLERIGHIQIADNPGRHEPGSGEINFPFLFAHIDRIGYDGFIGCEYLPSTTTEASLAWLHQWSARSSSDAAKLMRPPL